MITVVIVGILAGLATFGVKKFMASSKSAEPVQVIRQIKTGQEQYKAETFTYLDVSGNHTLTSYYPVATPSSKVAGWGDVTTAQGKAFRELGVTMDAGVRFTYACGAGGPSDSVPSANVSYAVTNWPTAVSNQWFVVRAIGDLDDDGIQSVFASSSFTGQIIVDKDGE